MGGGAGTESLKRVASPIIPGRRTRGSGVSHSAREDQVKNGLTVPSSPVSSAAGSPMFRERSDARAAHVAGSASL